MLRFEKSTLIDAPVEVVWEFHELPDILEKLTPPWQPVTIVRREGGLEVGAISEFRINLRFTQIPWIVKHVECEKPHSFTDIQTDGPLQSWRHHHQFIPVEGKTRLTDTIDYEIPGGRPTEFLLKWWVNSRLEEMFKYRHQVTKQECERYEDRSF